MMNLNALVCSHYFLSLFLQVISVIIVFLGHRANLRIQNVSIALVNVIEPVLLLFWKFLFFSVDFVESRNCTFCWMHRFQNFSLLFMLERQFNCYVAIRKAPHEQTNQQTQHEILFQIFISKTEKWFCFGWTMSWQVHILSIFKISTYKKEKKYLFVIRWYLVFCSLCFVFLFHKSQFKEQRSYRFFFKKEYFPFYFHFIRASFYGERKATTKSNKNKTAIKKETKIYRVYTRATCFVAYFRWFAKKKLS